MSTYKIIFLIPLISAFVISLISNWIFHGDWPFLPFPALVGVLLVAFQNETRVHKFLSKLAAGSLLFGFLSMFFISMRMYLLSRFVHDVNFPFWFWVEGDSLIMILVFAFIAFLGGLIGIVFRGFYSLYKPKTDKLILVIGPVVLTLVSLLVVKIKYGGTIASQLFGWPNSFLIRQTKDMVDGFLINKWIFNPGSLYHYLIENYLFYFLILFSVYLTARIVNKELERKINISLVLLLAIVFISSLLASSRPIEQSYIEREIVKAGYCEVDSDCVVAASKCPFGCHITVNKNEAERIRGLVNSFDSTCAYSCVELKDVICENNKCRAVWESPDDVKRKNAIAAVRTYAAQRAKINESEIDIIEVNKKDWPDACLGLPSEEEMCAAVITPGYEIITKAKEQRFIYRTNEDGSQVRAE